MKTAAILVAALLLGAAPRGEAQPAFGAQALLRHVADHDDRVDIQIANLTGQQVVWLAGDPKNDDFNIWAITSNGFPSQGYQANLDSKVPSSMTTVQWLHTETNGFLGQTYQIWCGTGCPNTYGGSGWYRFKIMSYPYNAEAMSVDIAMAWSVFKLVTSAAEVVCGDEIAWGELLENANDAIEEGNELADAPNNVWTGVVYPDDTLKTPTDKLAYPIVPATWQRQDHVAVDINGVYVVQVIGINHLSALTGNTQYTVNIYTKAQWQCYHDGACPPVINFFKTDPDSILPGDKTRLRWQTTYAKTASIDNGVGAVDTESDLVGIAVQPAKTTTYTLTVTGPNGVPATAQATVTVAPPQITSFTANPAAAMPGDTVTLSWQTVLATSGTIDNGVGAVPAQGSVTATVAGPTTYTLTVTGSGGVTASARASVASKAEMTVNLPGNVPLTLERVPAGIFSMGSPAAEKGRDPGETPHSVVLPQDYFVARTDVTQAQWQAVTGTNPVSGAAASPTNPVTNVSWNDVRGPGGFLEKLNAWLSSSGQAAAGTFRLPTSAEWERAARGGASTRFFFGDAIALGDGGCAVAGNAAADPYAWWCGNSGGAVHAVAGKKSNPYGLFDVLGNVQQWVEDWVGDYPIGVVTNPAGPPNGTKKVTRGGSYETPLNSCRSAAAGSMEPDRSAADVGLRLAVVPPPSGKLAPKFTSLSFSPSRVPAGQPATLAWTTTDTDHVYLDDGSTASVVGPSGSQVASPKQTTTYTLSATGPGGTVTTRITLDVGQDVTIVLPGGLPLHLARAPAGTFSMGSPRSEAGHMQDETLHTVTLAKDTFLGKTHVTQAQWLAVTGSPMPLDCGSKGVGEAFPVYCVSWNDVAGPGGFVEKLNAWMASSGQAGLGKVRLPTEAEWERAARGGTQTRFWFGDAPGSDLFANPAAEPYLWYGFNSGGQTQTVGTKPANPYGLFDVAGNLKEWVADWYYIEAYGSRAVTDPVGPATGTKRVNRGGYWNEILVNCRAAARFDTEPASRNAQTGFRLGLSL